MHMSNSSQTVDALDHFYDENLALLQQNFVPLMSLFVLPLQINDKLAFRGVGRYPSHSIV